jgi:hypothetical protein
VKINSTAVQQRYKTGASQHHEDVIGNEGIVPPFLISALDGGEWLASHSSHLTPQGKNPWHPLDRRLGGS